MAAISPAAVFLTAGGVRVLQPQRVDAELANPYRAPEQVRGSQGGLAERHFLLRRADVRMVSGRRPFPGGGAELDERHRVQPAAALNAKKPIHAAMEGAIAGCLQKDPGRPPAAHPERHDRAETGGPRWPRASDCILPVSPARPEVAAGGFRRGPGVHRFGGSHPAGFPSRASAQTPLDPLVGDGACLSSLRWRPSRRSLRCCWCATAPTTPGPAASRVPPPEHASYSGTPSISPDGRYVACAAPGADGQPLLWLRPFDETKASSMWISIEGSDGAFAPFWAPDSRAVAFFAKGLLKRVAVGQRRAAGQAGRALRDGRQRRRRPWSHNGAILFAPGQESGLSRITSGGGKPQPVLKLDPQKSEIAFLWPQFLPDRKHFIFFVQTSLPETSGIRHRHPRSAVVSLPVAVRQQRGLLAHGGRSFVQERILAIHPRSSPDGAGVQSR